MMDQFYLKNATKYQNLVQAFDNATPVPRIGKRATEATSPDIVVSARIRPLLKEDIASGFPCAVFPRSVQMDVVDVHDLYNNPRGGPVLKSSTFQVDRLFDSQATTEDIYHNLVADLIPFACNGGIGTLFAYGQTGSGKTFTISQLQKLVAVSLMDEGLEGEKEISITMVDLAGNAVYDLLNSRMPIQILEDSTGATQLMGVKEYPVYSKDELMSLIDRAASFRRTASTRKNDASSRSHAICRIRVRDPYMDSDGLLYLIDLAGSEAARDVAVHGAERMRETREINISLSVLKDCIRGKAESDALALSGGPRSKQKAPPRLPFRQSALTKVLKHVFDPSARRASKTVVIACVNPCIADVGASKNTLRYAELLRVVVPSANKTGANIPTIPTISGSTQLTDASESNLDALTEAVGRLGLRRRLSSRDLDPTAASVPFRERIRPGMVVSWNQSTGCDPVPRIAGDARMAVILCPVEAVPETVKDHFGNVVNPAGSEDSDATVNVIDNTARYLCALVTRAPMAEAYELNLWQQIVVDADLMDKEVSLEYDPGTRYYYTTMK